VIYLARFLFVIVHGFRCKVSGDFCFLLYFICNFIILFLIVYVFFWWFCEIRFGSGGEISHNLWACKLVLMFFFNV
jgi:hypothetical protein